MHILAKQKLPHKPGVYCFLDSNNVVLYIGKAKNLHKRTRYYFLQDKLCFRLRQMVQEAVSLEFYITGTENEAFLLESQLIKQKQPRYNIQYKHGRRFSYLWFSNHLYPQVKIIKQWEAGAIGPFLSYSNLKTVIDEMLTFFKLRTCSDFTLKRRKHPCLEYYSKKCSAPCMSLVNSEAYAQNVEQMRNVFLGKSSKVRSLLKKELKNSITQEKFENASKITSLIKYISDFNEKQSIFFADIKKLDVVLFYKGVFYLESIRSGAITHIEYRKYAKVLSPEEIMHEYYLDDSNVKIVGEIALDWPGYKCVLQAKELKVLDAAKDRFVSLLKEDEMLDSWIDILGLDRLEIIEAYDCSHYNSKKPICGMIKANVDGELLKNRYKLYRMPHNSYDDLEILEYGLRRRVLEGDLPDLILIDGGLSQLRLAKKILFPYSNIIAYAKGKNRKGGIVYAYNEKTLSILDKQLLLFLENLRSQAHNWVKRNAEISFSLLY